MKFKSIAFASLGIVVVTTAAALVGYQQYNKSSNSNTNSNVSVQSGNTDTSNSNTVKPIKNNLIGTWIDTATDSKIKLVITEDEYTEFNDGEETGRSKYKLLDEQTVEIMVANSPSQFKATVEGDTLTIAANKESQKYRRETATAATETTDEKIEKIKKQIIGTWVLQQGRQVVVRDDEGIPIRENGRMKVNYEWTSQRRFIFSEDFVQILNFNGRDGSFIANWIGPYRLKDEKTLEVFQGAGQMPFNREYKIKVGENGKLVFDDKNETRIVRESNNSNLLFSDEKFPNDVIDPKAAGWWGSNDDKVVIFHDSFCRINADGTFKKDRLLQGSYQSESILMESGEKVLSTATSLNILNKNGRGKIYRRLADWTEDFPCE